MFCLLYRYVLNFSLQIQPLKNTYTTKNFFTQFLNFGAPILLGMAENVISGCLLSVDVYVEGNSLMLKILGWTIGKSWSSILGNVVVDDFHSCSHTSLRLGNTVLVPCHTHTGTWFTPLFAGWELTPLCVGSPLAMCPHGSSHQKWRLYVLSSIARMQPFKDAFLSTKQMWNRALLKDWKWCFLGGSLLSVLSKWSYYHLSAVEYFSFLELFLFVF